MMERSVAMGKIYSERVRQERLRESGKFKNTCASEDMPDHEKLAVLGEEFGEVCGAVLNAARSAVDRPDANVETELIHVAAVCLAWLEAIGKDTTSANQ